jgi:hypothetical protein
MNEVCDWFEGNNFQVAKATNGAVLRSTVDLGVDCEACCVGYGAAERGEVNVLVCRFQLGPRSPLQLPRWAAFIRALCDRFALRIRVSDAVTAGPDDLLTVVRGSEAWQYFADHYGWSEPRE